MRVALFPDARAAQPTSFLTLLHKAVNASGAIDVGARRLRPGWCLRQHEVDVVHLHWLEYLAASDPGRWRGLVRTWYRIIRLLTSLVILRLRRVTVVWTVHNLAPHQPIRPRAERFCAQAVYLLADEVIVHSRYAQARVQERFRGRRRPAHVIPHPNYVGVFPASPQSRSEARRSLGLPQAAYVYLAFGLIRRYKRLDLLVEQFGRLHGPRLRLVIVGAAPEPTELEMLRQVAARDSRIILRPGYVAEEMVATVHRAADSAVLAYADVFSSGALLLSLSFGVPVVAPAHGTAAELFKPPAVELFVGDEIADALERVRGGDRADAARASAARFPWSAAGEQTVAVYRRAASRR